MAEKKKMIGIAVGIILTAGFAAAGMYGKKEPVEMTQSAAYIGETEKDSITETADEKLKNWAFWGCVEIKYKGWAGMASVDQILVNSENSDFKQQVEKYITFEPAEDYNNLKEGDKITINAIFDENELKKQGLKIEETSMEFTVNDVNTIQQVCSYHDGVAWAEVRCGMDDNWSLLDKDGNIIYQLDKGSYPVTHYTNGICIVDFQRVVDKSGNTIWSIEKDGNTYADSVWGSENVENITIYNNWNSDVRPNEVAGLVENDFFGYIQVEFSVNTFDYSGSYTGFLDKDGIWYLDPVSMQASILDGENGVYRIAKSDGTEGRYNLLTNETIWLDRDNKDAYYLQAGKWNCEYYSSLHNGLIFVSAGALGDTIYDGMELSDYQKSFRDSSGNMIIDLSKYDLFYPYPVFRDGYAILRIYNDQQRKYYTIIDTSGNEVFTPRALNEIGTGCSEGCSQDLYWVDEGEKGIIYYKVSGEQAFSFDFKLKSGTEFNEDRALIQSEDNVYYVIDLEGRLIF